MNKVTLEKVYRYLEAPSSFTEDEVYEIHDYLVKIKEKLHSLNLQFGTDFTLSEYVTTLLEKDRIAV